MMPEVTTVVVTRVDGGLTVVRVITTEYASDGTVRWHREPTPEYIDSIIAKHAWKGPMAPVSWRVVPNDFVGEGTDRTYRNAWKDDGVGRPGHDMVKARNVHRDKLRRDRARLLDDLDVQYQMADERGDQQKKREVAAEKQRLRDITDDPRIEAAQTVEELKAIAAT